MGWPGIGWMDWKDGVERWHGIALDGWMLKQTDNLIAEISFLKLPKIFYNVVF